jgi:hypothetical protein
MKNLYSINFCLTGFMILLTSFWGYAQQNVVIGKRTAPRGIISFSASSTLTGIGNTKHVDGYVKKYGNTAFTFPVGDNGVYKPFAAAADGTTGAYFQENPNTTTIPLGSPFFLANKDGSLGNISNNEFWDIDGANNTKISLSWNAASNIAALTGNSLSALTIVGWNPNTSKWEKIPSIMDNISLLGGSSSLTSGSITTQSTLIPDAYAVYTLGAAASAPLPVNLLSFKATLDDSKTVSLDWVTISEKNSRQFDLERSTDAKSWKLLGSTDAGGESSSRLNYSFKDKSPAGGENLYRVKMIDLDGSFAYSHIESITLAGNREVVFYPNPVADRLYIDANDPGMVKEVNFYDMSGSKLLTSKATGTSGIEVKNLVPGMYLVQMILSDGTTNSSKVIVTR